MPTTDRKLRVFLCHSSQDKPIVRELYQRLNAEGWIDPWLDEEKLLPGQDWDMEIGKAVEATDAVIVCLSKSSVNKEGYIQKEIKKVLDISDQKPEGTIFVIPLRLEECEPPRRLVKWQYVDYFPVANKEQKFRLLLTGLISRATTIDVKYELFQRNFDGLEFVRVPKGEFLMGSQEDNKLANEDEKPQHMVDIPYDYWISRFPVTNEQFNRFVTFNNLSHPISGLEEKKKHPAIYINWYIAMRYLFWLNDLLKDELPTGFVLRLPTEAEWEKAARGADGREWPWGSTFDRSLCNTYESSVNDTTPVGLYSPNDNSPYGCADMVGNVWEWTRTRMKKYPYKVDAGWDDDTDLDHCVLRGGSYTFGRQSARCAFRIDDCDLDDCDLKEDNAVGVRPVIAPPINEKGIYRNLYPFLYFRRET